MAGPHGCSIPLGLAVRQFAINDGNSGWRLKSKHRIRKGRVEAPILEAQFYFHAACLTHDQPRQFSAFARNFEKDSITSAGAENALRFLRARGGSLLLPSYFSTQHGVAF